MDVEVRDAPTEVRPAGPGYADLLRRALRKRHVSRWVDGGPQDRLTESTAQVVLERVPRDPQYTLVPRDGAGQVVTGEADVVDRQDANGQERLRRVNAIEAGACGHDRSRAGCDGEGHEEITARDGSTSPGIADSRSHW